MLSPRWRKVIGDLLGNKARTLLVIIAIAVGVFAFGSVFITQEVLIKNLELEYKNANSATIMLFLSDFDDTLIRWVESAEGVSSADAEAGNSVKFISKSGKEIGLNLNSVPDFSKMKLNLLQPKSGIFPPNKGELILERGSLTPSQANIGDEITVKNANDREFHLIYTGTVYDNFAFPYVFTNQMTGYISWDTLGFLGYPKRYNQLNIATDQSIKTLSDAEKLTFDLTEELKDRGVEVRGTQVFKPNQHWAEDNSKAFTAILSIIGVFSLILSGFLVVNTISALMTQQKKQVGIMKAIGGTNRQVISLYLMMVFVYGILALLIALPIGIFLGYVFLKSVANFLNLDTKLFYLPKNVFIMQLLAALVIPTAAALIPVLQGVKTSIREVISDYKLESKTGIVDRILSGIHGLSRPMLISLRNAFRKKGRLALTLGTLVVSGSLFMSVINVRSGMYLELTRILQMFNFEVSISLDKDYPISGLVSRINEVENVSAVEARTFVSSRRIKPDGSKGSPFRISGLPPETVFSTPVILSGRWLREKDQYQIVLSSSYIRDNPDIVVGDDLYVEIGNDKYHFEVVGIIAMSSDQKIGFMDYNSLAQIKDKPQMASFFMIKTQPNDGSTQDKVATLISDRLKRSGVIVAAKETRSQIFTSASNQFDFMIYFLLAMAVMVAIVGGLGLAGTMSLNVMERTREIGIMRSIGANDRTIHRLVLTEGVLVGFISWLISLPLSLPMTFGFCYAIGNAFFGRTLVFTVVPVGILIWLVVVMIIAFVASFVPARRASKMSISDTLNYE